jgi:hypothetical protein
MNDAVDKSTIFTLFDFPGVGKTTNVVEAARYHKKLLIRMSMSNCSLVKSADIKKYSTQIERTEVVVIDMISKVLCAVVHRMLEIAMEKINENTGMDHITVEENGVRLPDVYDDLTNTHMDTAVDEYIKNIQSMTGKEILLHFDECQQWQQQRGFIRYDKNQRITKPVKEENIMEYRMISLTAYLAKKQKMKTVFTGTNIQLGMQITVDSGIKLHSKGWYVIPYANANTIHSIVTKFCHFDLSIIETQLKKSWKRLEGPVRLTEYFLQALLEDCRNKARRNVTIVDVESAIDKAVGNFGMYVRNRFAKLNEEAIAKMVFYSMYPEFFGGKRSWLDFLEHKFFKQYENEMHKDAIEDTKVFGAMFNKQSIPKEWFDFENTGVVRLLPSINEDEIILLRPFPALTRFWANNCPNLFFSRDRQFLVS